MISRTFFCVWLLLCVVLQSQAQSPTLFPVGNQSLPNLYQTGQRYSVRLLYTDPKGDAITKAVFHDESRSGNIDIDMKSVEGSPEDGATIIWEINGFEKGDHKGYFVVTTDAKPVRYPEVTTQFYTFKVHSVVDKWILVGGLMVLCFSLLPWLIFTGMRTVNRKGSATGAAKVALSVGAVAALSTFVWQFLGIYDNPIIFILAGVVFVAIMIGLVARR